MSRYQRSPDPKASRERRRLLAFAGAMPPNRARRFTLGEMAVLKIVADEFAAFEHCECSLDEIAARAGVCRSWAKQTIRKAERARLLSVQCRPRPGQKNDTNVLTCTAPDWRAWIERSWRRRWNEMRAAANAGGSAERDSDRPLVTR